MTCSLHRIWSCAHTLRRDQESGTQVGVEIGMWKKLSGQFHLKFGVSRRSGQKNGGLQAGIIGKQVDTGIGAASWI